MSRRSESFERHELNDGFYVIFRETTNGMGGYQPVNMMLYRDDEVFVREITDSLGNFIEYPGAVEGKWEDELAIQFYTCTQFVAGFSNFVDGLCCLAWMVQPAAEYWDDEYGFGGSGENEIWLYALMDKQGQFVTEFSETKEEKYEVHYL